MLSKLVLAGRGEAPTKLKARPNKTRGRTRRHMVEKLIVCMTYCRESFKRLLIDSESIVVLMCLVLLLKRRRERILKAEKRGFIPG